MTVCLAPSPVCIIISEDAGVNLQASLCRQLACRLAERDETCSDKAAVRCADLVET